VVTLFYQTVIDHVYFYEIKFAKLIIRYLSPKISVSSFMGYLKGKSALMIFDRHANLKYKFGNRHFWSEGYYVSTVGLNEATIKKYIQDQEKYDIMQDKLSVKEYEDPFKG
jgi:putative transposase